MIGHEECKACMDDKFNYYCTDYGVQLATSSPSKDWVGYCCNGNRWDLKNQCNSVKLECSPEYLEIDAPSFKYGLCGYYQDKCGQSQDIYVHEYSQILEVNSLDTTMSCMWRFISSTVKDSDKKQIKIRVTDQSKVSIFAALQVDSDKVNLRERLGLQWDVMSSEDDAGLKAGNYASEDEQAGLIILPLDSILYVQALPTDYGGYVKFDYFITDEWTNNPNDTSTTSDDSSTTTSTDTDEFNGFSRKLVAYTLTGIFAIMFLLGLLQIYRIFYSKDAKLKKLYEEQIRKKKQEELQLKHRRDKELQYMNQKDQKNAKWQFDNMNIYLHQLNHEKVEDALLDDEVQDNEVTQTHEEEDYYEETPADLPKKNGNPDDDETFVPANDDLYYRVNEAVAKHARQKMDEGQDIEKNIQKQNINEQIESLIDITQQKEVTKQQLQYQNNDLNKQLNNQIQNERIVDEHQIDADFEQLTKMSSSSKKKKKPNKDQKRKKSSNKSLKQKSPLNSQLEQTDLAFFPQDPQSMNQSAYSKNSDSTGNNSIIVKQQLAMFNDGAYQQERSSNNKQIEQEITQNSLKSSKSNTYQNIEQTQQNTQQQQQVQIQKTPDKTQQKTSKRMKEQQETEEEELFDETDININIKRKKNQEEEQV